MDVFNQLRKNPENPRTIKDDSFKKLVKKIEQFPQMLEKRPIVYDSTQDYLILGGNRRYDAVSALKKKGFIIKDSYMSDASDWTDEQKREFIVTDNISDGDWDYDILANNYEAAELEEWGLELPKDFLPETETEEDEPPQVDETQTVSQLGQVYQLGRHRLMCGDATKIEDVEKLVDGQKADMVLTDPPYGIGIDGQKQSTASDPKHNRKEHEFRGWDKERPTQDLFNYILALQIPTAIFGGNYFADLLPASRGWIYWGKGQDGELTSSDGELAWTNTQKPLRAVTVNRGELNGSVHPTQKPLTVVQFTLDYLGEGGKVLDLFGGSGSTLIACEQANRTCYMMELDPKYVDVIRKRYAKFIGKEDNWQEVTPIANSKNQ